MAAWPAPALAQSAPGLSQQQQELASLAEGPWVVEDVRQNLHVVINVADFDATIKFYQEELGMSLIRSRPGNAFLGYGPETYGSSEIGHCVFELSNDPAVKSYPVGSGFDHFTLALPKGAGGPATRGSGDVVTLRDPTGYTFQVTRTSTPVQEPFAQVAFKVSNLAESVRFYTKVLGMTEFPVTDRPDCSTVALGYGPPGSSTTFLLIQSDDGAAKPVDKGKAYVQMAVSTRDVYETAAQIRRAGGKIVREPGPIPGLGTQVTFAVDPDGWRFAFVDLSDFLGEMTRKA